MLDFCADLPERSFAKNEVLLEEGADVHNARRWIQARGGRVAVMLPPRVLAGWIPPSLDAALVGQAGIRSLHRDAAPSDSEFSDGATRSAARYFDRIVQGRLPQWQIINSRHSDYFTFRQISLSLLMVK